MDGLDWIGWYPGGRRYRAPYGANKRTSDSERWLHLGSHPFGNVMKLSGVFFQKLLGKFTCFGKNSIQFNVRDP